MNYEQSLLFYFVKHLLGERKQMGSPLYLIQDSAIFVQGEEPSRIYICKIQCVRISPGNILLFRKNQPA